MSPMLCQLAVLLAAAAPAPSAAGVRLVEISTSSVDLTVQEGALERLEVFEGNTPRPGWVSIQGDRAVVRLQDDADDVRVVVPAGRMVDVNTDSGDVEVNGAYERLMVRTVSGNIQGNVNARELWVKSMSGDVQLTARSTRARMETVTGNIQCAGQLEELQARSTSGDVEVTGRLPRGLEVKTVSGNVVMTGPMPEDVVYAVHTVSGDVTLKDVGATGLRVAARSRTGTLSIPGATTEMPGKVRLVRGNGRGSVDLQTLSGDITLQQ